MTAIPETFSPIATKIIQPLAGGRRLSDRSGTLTAMARDLPTPLHELIELQCRVLTAGQALKAGMSRSEIRSRLKQARWQCLYPGVYATFSGEPGRMATLWGAVLSAGPGAVLSYQSAAELEKLLDTPWPVVHVTIPDARRVAKHDGLIIHRSALAVRSKHPLRLPPRTRIEDTVLDLAGQAETLDQAIGWLTKALGKGLTTRSKLRAAMAARARIRWRSSFAELLSEDMHGVLSVLEFRYVRDVERPHALPRGKRQVRSRTGGRSLYRDVSYELYLLVIELDGQLAHPAESRWSDIRRDNAAAAEGLTTLRYGWSEITRNPCQVAAEIAAVLSQRGFHCRPCSPVCPVGSIATQPKQA